jgi:FkbM family methyltransferase
VPNHPDFHVQWQNNCEWRRDENLLRCVFVASRRRLDNPQLVPLLEASELDRAAGTFQPLAAPASEVWLDVGAHLGEKSLSFAARNPGTRVYAFEPNLKRASQLMGRLPNYVVVPMAVSEEDGSAPFYLNDFDAASSLLPFVPEGLAQWTGGEVLRVEASPTVPTIRLDTFLNQVGAGRVAYLKIDAQGADFAVVRSLGERVKDVDRISLEVQITAIPLYRGAAQKSEVIEFLTAAGFELTSVEQQSAGQEENLTFVRCRA